MRARRIWRAALVLLLISWPLTFLYTSVGIDTEWDEGGAIHERFWRIRWPGNGSVMAGMIDQHRRPEKKPLETFDLGGAFLRRAGWPRTPTLWNKLGFWWINHHPGDPPTALPRQVHRAILVGVPHWLLIVIAALGGRYLVPAPRRGGCTISGAKRKP